MDFSSISSIFLLWTGKIVFWGIIALILAFFSFGILILRKRRRMKIPVIELTTLSDNKVGFKILLGGWVKTRNIFFGLIQMGGEDKFMTRDGREVQNASSEDFQHIGGRLGLVVQRKGDDPKVLLPINKISLDQESQEMINTIAPADFRDTSSKIIRASENETMSKFDRFIQQAMPIIQAVAFFLCILFTIQYVKHSQTEAWLNTQEAIKLAYKNKGVVVESVTAPLFLFFKRKWFK